jgi:hypothetical protein
MRLDKVRIIYSTAAWKYGRLSLELHYRNHQWKKIVHRIRTLHFLSINSKKCFARSFKIKSHFLSWCTYNVRRKIRCAVVCCALLLIIPGSKYFVLTEIITSRTLCVIVYYIYCNNYWLSFDGDSVLNCGLFSFGSNTEHWLWWSSMWCCCYGGGRRKSSGISAPPPQLLNKRIHNMVFPTNSVAGACIAIDTSIDLIISVGRCKEPGYCSQYRLGNWRSCFDSRQKQLILLLKVYRPSLGPTSLFFNLLAPEFDI